MKREAAIINDLVMDIKGIRAADGYSADVAATDVSLFRSSIIPAGRTEVINVVYSLLYGDMGSKQVLSVTIEIGVKKGASNYSFLVGRVKDIMEKLFSTEGEYSDKYGYYVLSPADGGVSYEFSQDEEELGSATIELEIIHAEDEKWENDNEEYL